jgi:hypothetical protein
MRVKSIKGGIIDLFINRWEMRLGTYDNVDLVVSGVCNRDVIFWRFDAPVSWEHPKIYYSGV